MKELGRRQWAGSAGSPSWAARRLWAQSRRPDFASWVTVSKDKADIELWNTDMIQAQTRSLEHDKSVYKHLGTGVGGCSDSGSAVMEGATWTISLAWWITVVELPLILGAYGLILKRGRDFDRELASLSRDLQDYKLAAAQTFASIGYLKDVENRLTAHLDAIEKKLDRLIFSKRNGGGGSG